MTRTVHGPERLQDQELARGETNAAGVFGFSTPAELTSSQMELCLESPHHNPRRGRLDGTRAQSGLQHKIYGE